MATLQEQARDEAYASAPASKPIVTVIKLDEESFLEPVYLIRGPEEDTVIRLETGESVTAIACGYKVTLHGFDNKGPTTAKAEISNVSGRIRPYVKSARNPIRVEYRAYYAHDLTKPIDIITGYLLKEVSVTATLCQGDLSFAEISTQAFPLRTYDIDTYPGLWNS
jgi:hypothetical protein